MAEEIATSVLSIGAGVAAVAGGVAITALTGGLGYLFGGGALIGAGSSLVVNPIQKQITGERMTWADTASDVVVGATIGAITGPIGSGLSGVAKGASGVVKCGVRMGAGAIAGSVSGTVSETAKAIQGGEVSVGSYAKAIGIGAVAGTVGGASTHIGSNLSKGLSSGIGQAATRIGVQATAGAATDASLQYLDKGEVDIKQLALNTVGQVTVATTAEVSHSVSKQTNAYVNKTNSEMIDDRLKEVQKDLETQKMHKENLLKINKDPTLSTNEKTIARREYAKQYGLKETNVLKNVNKKIDSHMKKFGEAPAWDEKKHFEKIKSNIMKVSQDVNALPANVVEQNLQNAQEYKDVQQKKEAKQVTYNNHERQIRNINQNPALTPREKFESKQQYARDNGLNERRPLQNLERNIRSLEQRAAQLVPQLIGDNNIHALRGQHEGRFAVDLPPSADAKTDRGQRRAIFEKHGNRLIYSDHFYDHDYRNCRTDVGNLIPDPFDALRPEHLNRNTMDDEETNGHCKTE